MSLLLLLSVFVSVFFSKTITITAATVYTITQSDVCIGDDNPNGENNKSFCVTTSLPSTSLSALISAKVSGFNATDDDFNPTNRGPNHPSETAYYKDNLLTYPDSQYFNYTSVWKPRFPSPPPSPRRLLLSLGPAGHHVTVLSGPNVLHSSLGNWRTREVDVSGMDLSIITIVTRPPARPGKTSRDCPSYDDDDDDGDKPNCGQGGDHVLASNAGAMQFAAGWDWCQGVPDRVTGLFGAVALVGTGEGRRGEYGQVRARGVEGVMDVVVRVGGGAAAARGAEGRADLVVSFEGETVAKAALAVGPATEEGDDVAFEGVSIPDVKLWYPWTLGEQPMYDFAVSFDGGEAYEWRSAVRVFETYVDEFTGGRAWKVNGLKVRVIVIVIVRVRV